jgi:hypothetical protein
MVYTEKTGAHGCSHSVINAGMRYSKSRRRYMMEGVMDQYLDLVMISIYPTTVMQITTVLWILVHTCMMGSTSIGGRRISKLLRLKYTKLLISDYGYSNIQIIITEYNSDNAIFSYLLQRF